MSDRTQRVALIGAGRIAAVHAGYLRGIRTATVVGVCDSSPGQAARFAEERRLPAHFEDLDELFRVAEPSVVHICTPPRSHARLAIDCMERGANVLIEKPMAMSVEECDRMMATARSFGRLIAVDHNRLFDPVLLKLKRLIASGRLGEVVTVEAQQGVNPVEGGSTPSDHWSVADAFVPLWNLGPHPLYLVDALAGPFERMTVQGRPPAETEGLLREIRILLEGQKGDAFVSFSMGAQPYLNHLTVYGTKATARLNLNTMTMIVDRDRPLPKMVAKLAANIFPVIDLLTATATNAIGVATGRMKTYPGIGNHLRSFYRALDEGEAIPVDGEAGRRNVAALSEIERRLSPGADHQGDSPTWTS